MSQSTAQDEAVTSTTRQLAPLTRKRSLPYKPSAGVVKAAAPPLHPVVLEPEYTPPTSPPAITFLERIDRVEINETRERDGVTYYVLDVFLRRCDSRLPTVLAGFRHGSSAARARTTPDYQVERRFSDFRHLRADVFGETLIDPQFVCAYCVEFVLYVRLSLQQPRAITKFTTGPARRKTMLASFLNDFVRLGRSKEKQNHQCVHHAPVPQLIEGFLHDNDTLLSDERCSASDPLSRSRLSWSHE